MKKSQLRNIIRESIKELMDYGNEEQDIEPIEPDDVAKFPRFLSAPCECLTPDAFNTPLSVINHQHNDQLGFDQTWVYGGINNPHPAGIDCWYSSSGGRINGQNAQVGNTWVQDWMSSVFTYGVCQKVIYVGAQMPCNPNVNLPAGRLPGQACNPGKNNCGCPANPTPPTTPTVLTKRKPTQGGGPRQVKIDRMF